MINIRLATEEDKEGWNRVVEQSDYGTIYHTWEWKEVIEQGFNERTYMIVAEQDDEIIGVFPCFCRGVFADSEKYKRIPFVSKYNILWSPYPRAWSYGGPCTLPYINSNVVKEMFDYMEKLINMDKTIIDCRISPWDQSIANFCSSKEEWTVTARQTAVIDLTQGIEELWMNLNKKHRNSIRKAQNSNVRIVEAESEDDIKYFYFVLWNDLVKRNAMVCNPYSYFKALWDLSRKSNMIRFYFAEYGNKKIASLVVTYYKNMVLYEHGTFLREYSKVNSTNLLMWNAIEDGVARGYNIFDLGGMPPDENSGVYKFKAGWNGKIKQVDEYRKRFRFKMLREFKKMIILGD